MTATIVTSLGALARTSEPIVPFVDGVWEENANGTKTFLRFVWEPMGSVRGRFDPEPFRCPCQDVPGSYRHWDGCPYHRECVRRVKIEGPYDPSFMMDIHYHNTNGTITRIQVPHAIECRCRGAHVETCTSGLIPTYTCHCKFVDPNYPIHWDHCERVGHACRAQQASVPTNQAQWGSTMNHGSVAVGTNPPSWTLDSSDFSDTSSND